MQRLALAASGLVGARIGARPSSHPDARRWVSLLLATATALEVVHLGITYAAAFSAQSTAAPQVRAHPYTAPGYAR